MPKFGAQAMPHATPSHHVKRPVQMDLPPAAPVKFVPGFEEGVVATGPVSDAESKDLDAAIQEFIDLPQHAPKDADFSDYAKPFLHYIDTHRGSNWNTGLLLNMGLGYYHASYFSKAIASFELAWHYGRDAKSPEAHLMVDRAVAELARMHARLGHKAELEALFKDIGDRPIGGPAVEFMRGARQGLYGFEHDPGISYLCGPKALRNLLISLKASKKQIKTADDARSGPHGFSLTQLAALADKAKLKYKLVYRKPGQPVPVPSIVNWNEHHYAAIVGVTEGHFLIQDPTFGEDSPGDTLEKAIDAEASGYFLVPETVIAAHPDAGWRVVSAKSEEAEAVYGMGNTSAHEAGIYILCADQNPVGEGTLPFVIHVDSAPACPDCECNARRGGTRSVSAMTKADVMPLSVSLHLEDTPVGYRPQIGVANIDKVSYNQSDDDQPATFPVSNFSAQWAHGWQSYFTDTVAQLNVNGTRVAAGGGGIRYASGHYNTTTGVFTVPEPIDQSVLTRSPADPHMTPTQYERDMPDGSKEIYGQSNGATSGTRYWFLTDVYDAQGNHTVIHYVNVAMTHTWYIDYVQDAMGRQTTFSYTVTGHPLLITGITDPFSRSASFTYDASFRLATITDPVGITSTFTYSMSDPTFVTQLATPYGNTVFNETINPNDAVKTDTRSLTMTDPLSNVDYWYYYQNSAITPSTATVPTGLPGSDNGLLEWRNTYYWNRHAWAACVAASGCSITSGVPQSEDFTKAALSHFLHSPGTAIVNREIGSVKKALENRVWYNYPGQGTPYYEAGTYNQPTYTGRILSGGATQLSSATYNTQGNITSYVDAKGRSTQLNYDTNGIDLLTVKQLTAPATYTTIATYGSYTSHRPQTYTGADGQTWNYTYTGAGQLKTVTDPNSNVTTYNYDGTGRLSTIVDANSTTVLTLTYDADDRVQTREDSQGYILTYAYDDLDRITSITYPDSTTDLYDYDFQSGPYVGTASMELRKYTDRLGRVTTYNYDADQRLTSVVEPTTSMATRTTGYSYYEDGTLKEITDANSNVTHFDIDIESRPIDKIYAYGTGSAQTETYTWETNGARLSSITDALSQVKTFTYDVDDRVTGITYTSTVNTTPNVTFTWDTYFPRLSSMTDGLGTTNYSYTAIGSDGALRPSSIDGPYSNDTIGLTYDTLGRLSGRNISGGNETFGYDAINRLTSHGTPLGSFTIGYLGETDQVTSQSVTNGLVTVSTGWSYDTNTNDRRLTGITNSGVSRSYSFGYGSMPVNVYDIMSITDTAAGGHPWSTQSHSYTYDYADRLLTESVTAPGNSTFAYDDLDNATTWNTPASGSLTNTFTVLNQINAWGGNSYSYDADGNTLSGDGVKTYKWDAENRLIEIDYVGTMNKSVFSYDGMGRRTVDAETVSGVTTTTRYLWCGSRICQTRDGSDTVLRRDLAEGEYNVGSGQMLVYMPDQLGSVRDVIDASTGNLVQSYDYTPYGGVARSNGSTPTDYQYAGLFYHTNSGLNLSATRAQDGNTGRWLNRDPIRETGGINLYAYVGANGINDVDLQGTFEDNSNPYSKFTPWKPTIPGRPLSECEKSLLAPYIPDTDLNNARIYEGEVPPWLPARNGGITLGNGIYFRPGYYSGPTSPYNIGKLGHELVHVGQWRKGDLTDFNYIEATITGGGSDENSQNEFEMQAYGMEKRIRRELTDVFATSCTCKNPD